MTIGIYGIFDAQTDECLYVGLSRNIEERWVGHRKSLRRSKHKRSEFNFWFENHGSSFDSLAFKILEECEDNDNTLNLAEIKWFNSLKPLFYGKLPSKNEKWVLSSETREKQSQSMINFAREKGLVINKENKRLCLSCKENFTKSHKNIFCSKRCFQISRRKWKTDDISEENLKNAIKAGVIVTLLQIDLELKKSSLYSLLSKFGLTIKNIQK